MSNRLLGLVTLIAALLISVTPAHAVGWLPHSLNFPSGISQEKLLGISCSTTTACTAVGQDWNGSNWGAHAESGAGSGWTNQTGVTRNPGPKNGVLNGSSCLSTTPCVTAGSYGDSGGQPNGMVQVQAPTGTWPLTSLTPANGSLGTTQFALYGISCPTANWCEGVGYGLVSGDSKATAVTIVRSPLSVAISGAQPLTNAALRGVSCTSMTFCMAVGTTAGTAMAQRYNGSIWTSTAAPPTPAGSSANILNGVSCVTSTWCMAVGKYQDGTGDHALADLWNGTTWTQKTLPATTGTSIAYGVSCFSITVCHSVGAGSGDTVPQADGWNGSVWAAEATPLAGGAGNAALTGVSCAATTHCEASGWSTFGGTPTGLVETYS